ncbi:hypothetical protein Cni_G10897 [Canna indica]|uniref:Uncharacterized protein n=1 Tax=Canna indica TaxID=4628 RepID=A0AAQ3K514_9LILI|nr:hypothetical protein Cni_G10897 [Canna indica]
MPEVLWEHGWIGKRICFRVVQALSALLWRQVLLFFETREKVIEVMDEEGEVNGERNDEVGVLAGNVAKKTSGESENREEYHLSGNDGNYLSQTVMLNGTPLELTE